MTDVTSLSRSAGTFSPGSSTHKPEVRSDGKSDSDDTTVEELEGLLKQYTDPEKRVKIRDTIRLLKQSLQEGDSSSSGSHNLQATHKTVFSTHTGSSPQQDEERGAVEFTVSLQQKSPASSISRFAGRSTSLRNPRPSYQPSAQAVNRANSFKLSRPKDFILQKVGSSPQLTKVPETPPDDFKEYADSLNNNLPQYKTPDSTSFTHNKTASPFSTTPQTAFKKQLWTPPNSTSNAQQKTAFSSSPLARTSAASSLRRSESTKENRSSDFKPISVVHGNVRRSKSILGRILGQKLGAEKSPFKASSPVLSQEQTTPKTESPSTILTKKPPIHSPPKSESPTPAPRAAPRSKPPSNTPSPTAEKSAPKKTPSPLLRSVQSPSSGEEKPADEASKSPASFRSISSSTSSSSSSSSGDHIYEIAGSESPDISSSESSKPRDSPTLSEIIQETREHHDNETVSVTQTSSVALSVDRDQHEELEGDQVFVETKIEKVEERTAEDDSVQLEEKLSQKTSKYTVLQPLKSHKVKVCEHETAQYFNVQIVRPIDPRKNNSTHQNSPLPKSSDVTEKSVPTENKETRKSSSSVSSISSASDSEEVLSDDEESSGDDIDIDMDRYSTRALQSRVSVKKQIMAKEGGENVETKTTTTTTNTTSSRRFRDRHNKPLNTGEDVKTRMQRFRGQVNGEAEKAPAPKRNVAVKIPGTAGKKLDVSKFEKGADKNAKISSSAGKTTVTLKTTAPRSSYPTTSREEKMKNGVHKEEKVEKLNGSTSPDVESEQKTSNLSSGSSADDGIRTRRARRGRGNAEAENGADKLEKASSIATSELKDLGKAKESTEIVITTKKSRERVSQIPKEDVNNNTKPAGDDIAAAPSENTAQDSLDDWSARRRKRREKRLEESSPATTSGTENEKSAEEMKEEEKVIIKQTRAKLHHTHSLPAMSEIGSLGGYKFKVEMNGGKDVPTHAEEEEEAEIEFKGNEEEEPNEIDTEVSEVKGQFSRSSDARSSTSSSNEDGEKSASPEDEGPSEVVMEIGVEERDVVADDIAENQSESSDRDVTQNEREWEETREVEEQKENGDDEQHQENTEDEESVDVDADDAKEDEIDAAVPADALDADKEMTENNRDSDESPTQTQTNADDAQSESIYNDEIVEIETLTETQREEETPVEPTPIEDEVVESTPAETEKVVEPEPEPVPEPKERPRRRHKEEQKETSAIEIESEKPRRRARRKDAEKTEEPVEEKPKRRHHRHKHHKEEVEEETPQKEEKVEEITEKVEEIKEKKSRRHKEKEQTPEVETPSETKEETPTKIESEPQEKPKAEAEEAPKAMHISIDNVEEITDLKVLEKMLEVAAEYEDRRRIRSVIRAVKRGEKPKVFKDSKYDSKSNGGINALNLQGSRKHEPKAGDLAKKGGLPQEGARESRFATSRTTVTKIEKSDGGSRFSSRTVEKTTRMTSGPKKIGSIFDRGDDDDDVKPKSRGSGSSRFADLERRQAERKREVHRNRSMPTASSKDARKAFVAKLEAGAPKPQGGKKVGRSPTFVVPNANNVKQLLLKWCQSKTRGYEHVDIMNFSSSWASGMAFCALVHNFFPDAFDYNKLDPKNKAENLELAFTKAEEIADIAPLLEVEDMLIMGNRPDSKCIFTYVQFMYNHLKKYDQPLVPIKEKGASPQLKVKGESPDL